MKTTSRGMECLKAHGPAQTMESLVKYFSIEYSYGTRGRKGGRGGGEGIRCVEKIFQSYRSLKVKVDI